MNVAEVMAEILPVVAIVVICYFLAELFKAVDKDSAYTRFIPAFCMGCGAIIGVVAFYIAPSIMSADNIIMAIAVGIMSGLTATGTNQFYQKVIKGGK